MNFVPGQSFTSLNRALNQIAAASKVINVHHETINKLATLINGPQDLPRVNLGHVHKRPVPHIPIDRD